MTIIQAGRLVETEPDFRVRVRHFIVKAAIAIVAEDPITVNHADRLVLSASILGNADGYVTRFGYACMTNATLLAAADQTAIADNDLEFAVNSLIDAFAG
jgi:hypothetical protein